MNVAAPGAELFYSIHGDGPPCLVLSGIGTEPYEHQIPTQLSDRLKLVFVDLRGSGRSTGEATDLTFDRLADDLEVLRIELGVPRIAVLGHSILSILAIEYGRRCPGSVSHVITAGAPPSGDMGRLAAEGTRFFAEDASDERKRLLRENLSQLPPGASPKESILAQTPMRFFDGSFDASPLFAGAISRPEFLQHVMGTLAPAWDITAGASSLSVPIFLAHGRYDYVVPHVLWEGIPEKLPNATFQLFERSGHQPFFEEPKRFAEALGDWMERWR